MNIYIISQEHIDALRAMLERGLGRTGKPFSVTRRKQMEKTIKILEQERKHQQ